MVVDVAAPGGGEFHFGMAVALVVDDAGICCCCCWCRPEDGAGDGGGGGEVALKFRPCNNTMRPPSD